MSVGFWEALLQKCIYVLIQYTPLARASGKVEWKRRTFLLICMFPSEKNGNKHIIFQTVMEKKRSNYPEATEMCSYILQPL